MNQVFHAGMFAILTVTIIALHQYDLFGDINHLVSAHITQRFRQQWEGVGIIVGCT